MFEHDTGVSQADAWLARLMSPECAPDERAAFEDWLAQSPDNIAAYLEAERIHALAAGLGSEDLLRAAAHAARRKPAPAQRNWREWVPAAAAAVLVVAVATTTLWPRPAEKAIVQQFMTAQGEQREITLFDGTVLRLDTGSEITTDFDGDQRLVELVRGRAQFVVAADPDRPFLVKAGPGTVRDIGTTFQVSRIDGQVNVGLLEGRVDVSVGSGAQVRRSELAPGEQLTIDGRGVIGARQLLDLAAAHAWPQGDLVFRQRRLDELLAEMNRYSPVQLRLQDPALGSLQVSGVFHAGDQEALVAALERGWSLRAQREGAEEIVLSRPTQ
ncbi:FecR domain-containing protein [Lysobacter sp. S4-A87]|uniref:FecR family protein n=1 Tax=Lysobacter sp. S4-A87 TaxID=2925843 RepID=UPI001F52D6FA|nr:FecR domain-containing protein [Lysobacter sp. S4-A87]UNK49406.1 FecR domain-containing protein [Lysobacter sp. S4-A87]